MAISTNDQANAPQTVFGPAGASIQRCRMALTTIVNGFTSANQRSAAGIESVGTNADEMKVSGKTAMKPTEFAASGDFTSIPSSANSHENAYPNSSSSRTPSTISGTE